MEKIVALYTSRDRGDLGEPRRRPAHGRRRAADFAGLLTRHEGAWNSLWNRFDIELDSANEWTETVLHLHIFHLLQTVSPHTTAPGRRRPGARLARGGLPRPHLLGRDVHLPVPQLPAADPGQRAAASTVTRGSARPARQPGRPGTTARCSPGRAAPTEREETQQAAPQPEVGPLAARPLASAAARQHRDRLQRLAALHGHRRASAFLRFTGAELLIEIARFWASVATYNPRAGPLRDPRRDGARRVPRGLPRTPTSRACATTPTPTSWRSGCCSGRSQALDELPPHYRAGAGRAS